MSKMPLAQLVEAMQGKSESYGWDARTLYDQRKANELLFQLYVERFNTEDGYIEPMSMEAGWGDGSYKEHIYDLKLSAPRLSFEISNSTLPARARLTMDMVGGMIVSTKKSSGGPLFVSRMLKMLPVGGPQLWMDQPVTKGVVTGPGEVLIDLRKADNFMANFVIGDLAQAQVGMRFKEYFDINVPPKLRIFSLGSLDGDLNGVLTPKNFEIRTMKSDPLALFGDERYGDGAVMMFITLKDGQDGTGFPNENHLYLIPTDEEGKKHTGAMLLSSRILAEKVLKPALEGSIGNGLVLMVEDRGQDNASTLVATAGGGSAFHQSPSYKYWQGGADWGFENSAWTALDPFLYDFRGEGNPDSGLKVGYGVEGLTIDWAGSVSGQCKVKTSTIDDPSIFDFRCSFDIGMRFEVALDKETNYVELNNPEVVRDVYDVTFGANPMPAWNMGGEAATRSFISEQVQLLIRGTLNKIELPPIDTFLLRNLLFPGHNALHLTEAFAPGDLAVFGQIDPLRTTTVMAPLNSNIEASSTLQFTLTPMPDNVQWSVRDVDGESATPGVISSSGLYTAPSQAQLPNGFVAVMVTANGTLNGKAVQSSALVSVLSSLIVINPMYDSCDPGDDKVLSAQSLNGEELEWKILTPQWGSTLGVVEGDSNKRTYKAGGSSDPEIPFSLDKIEVKQTVNGKVIYAYLHVLIHNRMIATPMWISEESDPSTGTVQFELRGKNGPIDPALVTWKLLGGEGTFNDQTGVYTEPTSVAPGSFVVVSGTVPGDFQDTHAVAAVPLPLTKYAELIETVNATLRAG